MRLKLVEQNLVLLPGLDGTGSLFGPLLSVFPPEFTASVVSYPAEEHLTYKQLMSHIRARLPWDKPVTLVAESFSGPLALEFAASHPEQVKALILVCTFVTNPMPPWLKWTQPFLTDYWFKKPLSESLLRKYLLDQQSPEILVNALQRALQAVSPKVLAARVRELFAVDARVALQNFRKPILYLLAAQDDLLGKRGWETMAVYRPNMTTVVLDGPHLLLQRKPRECFAAMEKFLGAVDGTVEKPVAA